MLEGRTYVPLLHARLAEMRALRELSTPIKNLLVPVIRIRPWLNSKRLEKVFDVIEDAFGDRAFGLDLDQTKFDPTSEKEARQEFAALFDASNAFGAYYDFVAEKPNRIPVVRRDGALTPQMNLQAEKILALDRGCFFRVNIGQTGDYLDFANLCLQHEMENVVFVIDCGWRTDVLVQAVQCVGIANNILDVSQQFEIVVAASSFPDSFTGMGAKADFPINERILFQNVRQNINRGSLFYGDWGSTRPPTDPVPMTNVPRIDVAGRENWTAWRSEDGEDYGAIAERMVADPLWQADIDLWGDYMIVSTSEGLDPAIRAPAMAAAVRVNLHMNTQAQFDQPNGPPIADEPVGDDL